MKNVDYVRIVRVCSTAAAGSSKRGRLIGKPVDPIANGAWIEGTVIKPICLGKEFQVYCTCYNGKICIQGRVYKSSEVVLIRGDKVFTQDVEYKVLRVPRFDPVKSLRAWQ